MSTQNSLNIVSDFICETCDYKCCRKSDYIKHESTSKHQSHLNKTVPKSYTCDCGLVYKHRQSLNVHKKKCVVIEKPDNMSTLTNMVIELVKSNNDLQKQVVELCKGGTNVNTINGNNNNNKSFNINLYLAEQCKDAINFSEFINSIEVSREDLENNAQLGFVNGISKIILDHLKQLKSNERPIHCTDLKRETMYIKDENKWNKEENDAKLNSAIQSVSRKSVGTLMNWKGENEDYRDMDSKFSNRCITIQRNSMAGYDRDVYYPKVIHAIAREIMVSK